MKAYVRLLSLYKLISITETVCVLYVLRVEAKETAELLSMIHFKRRVSTLKSYRL
jgi:hypothetical protein